jgi:tetratricopeptide (TPR) repeat protein
MRPPAISVARRASARLTIALCAALAVPLVAQEPSARSGTVATAERVRVWEGTLTLPTYDEGLPDPNPPFDNLLPPGRPNYPYTIRDALTDVRRPRAWRALFLENEYLRCSVLPDLGGHLYSCTDKVNGAELFYDNQSIKFSNIAYRGSWAAFGIEFNFPVSHNWMTTSPVDFATEQHPDGSATIYVGNVDRPYGMQWTVALTLRPGRSVLEQRTALYNRSDVRRRFYWWTNAAVRAFDDTRILYPMKYTASHGFADVDTWPVDSRGTDNSVLKNHVHGPVSRFAHGSREGFMGVWHPRTNAGVAHYAAPEELPAKKIWSWGVNADAMDWRRQLSDDSSAYVEIQAGLFRDQETYGFLQPQDSVSFTEYWMPLRDLGGLTRMNPNAAMFMERVPLSTDSVEVRVALQVSRRLDTAKIGFGVRDRYRIVDTLLTPDSVVHLAVRLGADAAPVRLTVKLGAWVVVDHTEGVFDYLADSLIHHGPQPPRAWPAPSARSAGDWFSYGEDREVNGDMLAALAAYRRGVALDAGSTAGVRSAARLAVTLGHFREGESLATRVLVQQPSDHEMAYYRALARLALGDSARALLDFELAHQYGPFRVAAMLGALRASMHTKVIGVHLMREFVAAARNERDPWLRELALLASTSTMSKVGLSLDEMFPLAVRHDGVNDRINVVSRFARHVTGARDSTLMRHLAGDPARVLQLAEAFEVVGVGWWLEFVLSALPDDDGVVRERGMPHPRHHALVAYHRAFASDSAPHLDTAAALPLTYVFPNGKRDREVLEWALRKRPDDSSARYLLGMLAMQRGDVGTAVAMWDSVRAARPTGVPALYRNLGYALLLSGDTARAVEAFATGTSAEPDNPDVWVGNDSLSVLTGKRVADRAAALDRYRDKATMPTALVYRYARLLAGAGRFDEAESLFRDRFFSRVEGGTNPRGVWLEVRMARAESLAFRGACADARRVVASLARPVRALPFTRDGMAEQLRAPALARRVRATTARCEGR